MVNEALKNGQGRVITKFKHDRLPSAGTENLKRLARYRNEEPYRKTGQKGPFYDHSRQTCHTRNYEIVHLPAIYQY